MPSHGGASRPIVVTAGGSPLAGYTVWYDASDAASITSSVTLVSQWNDKSANGYHLTQGTGANQPVTGVDTINSLNALKFTGATPMFMTNTTFPTLAQPFTCFAVVKVNNTASSKTAVHGATSGQTAMTFDASEHCLIGMGSNLSGTSVVTTSVCCTIGNNTSSFVFKDGAQEATGAAGTASMTDIRIGANQTPSAGFDGDIGEVLIYPSSLSTGDRNTVEAYLKAKWGTP